MEKRVAEGLGGRCCYQLYIMLILSQIILNVLVISQYFSLSDRILKPGIDTSLVRIRATRPIRVVGCCNITKESDGLRASEVFGSLIFRPLSAAFRYCLQYLPTMRLFSPDGN